MNHYRTTGTKSAVFFLALLLSAPWPLQAEDKQGVLATVEGHTITEADIAGNIAAQMAQINNQIYMAKKRALDALIADQLLDREAKKRGLSREQLLQQEVNAKVTPVSDAEVAQFYNTNKARLGDKSLEELKTAIAQQLQGARVQQQQQAFVRDLRKAAAVKVLLKPPLVNIAIDGAPVRGKANAPVTLVEFSDFQ